MADDQVTIDPQFQPSPPGGDQNRWLKGGGIAAVVVAAFIMGWLLRSPTPNGSEPTEVAATSSTALAGASAESSTTTRPSTTTTATTTAPEAVRLEVPLGDAVPGFSDTVTMQHWGELSVDILRWRPTEASPETMLTFDHEEEFDSIAGVDVSGLWYALIRRGVLSVQQVAGGSGESWFESPFDAAVGVRATEAVWHDTEPGQLAWMSCPRPSAATGTVSTLDVTSDTARPVPIVSVDGTCGEESGMWISGWGDWGFAVGTEDRGADSPAQILFSPDGVEIARSDPSQGVFFVTGNPDGTTIWADHSDGSGQPESYVLSQDGERRSPVPGVAEGEFIDEALWAPDGSHLSLVLPPPDDAGVTLRIVDGATGAVLAEIEEPGWAWPRGWSTDSRYLLYGRWPEDFDWWGTGDDAELVFHDVSTDTAVAVPLPAQAGDIWVTDPAPPAELVAHYPLDGHATDVSGYNHDGTIIGEATTTGDRFGTPDVAYAFDGDNDYIVIDMAPELRAEAVSISAWVKMDNTASLRTEDQGSWYVVSYGDQGHFLTIDESGMAVVGLHFGWGDCVFRGTDSSVDDRLWHHLATTRDLNGTIRLYLDGAAQPLADEDRSSSADQTAATCAVTPAFGDQVWIGGDPMARDLFHGFIDDVRIYQGVLTEDEIGTLAATGTVTISVQDWSGVEGYQLLAGVRNGSDIVGGAFGTRIESDPFSGGDVVHPPEWSPPDSAEPHDDVRFWFADDYRWNQTARLQPGTYRIDFWANPYELKPYGNMIPSLPIERSCWIEVEVTAGEATTVVITDIPVGEGDAPCP